MESICAGRKYIIFFETAENFLIRSNSTKSKMMSYKFSEYLANFIPVI